MEISIRGVSLPEDSTTSDQVAAFVVPALAGIEPADSTILPPEGGTTNEAHRYVVTASDTILIRTNPGRDPERHGLHDTFLELMAIAERSEIKVINQPAQLNRFASKSSLLLLEPKYRPDMLVTGDLEQITDFVRAAPSECVVKPVVGSRGKNVIRVANDHADSTTLLATTFGDQQVVVQHFVAARHPGDRRVIVLDGEILEDSGNIAGIERHPATGDFRANLHAGGSAHPLQLNESEREAAQSAARLLFDHGIRLAGVDMIGDKIIEFNVFSTGGLYDGNRFAETDFTETIVRRFLA